MKRFFRGNLTYMELKSLQIANTTQPNCTRIYLFILLILKVFLIYMKFIYVPLQKRELSQQKKIINSVKKTVFSILR